MSALTLGALKALIYGHEIPDDAPVCVEVRDDVGRSYETASEAASVHLFTSGTARVVIHIYAE